MKQEELKQKIKILLKDSKEKLKHLEKEKKLYIKMEEWLQVLKIGTKKVVINHYIEELNKILK